VPSLQKQMTRMARRAGKPVVIATQMLESMIQSPVPTRAEVSDVATAVYEGADAIMLSAEWAAGKFPVEAVATMNRIGEEVEREPTYRGVLNAQRAEPEPTVGDAIADAARQIAETLDLSAIICWTSSGSTALRVARERPKPPVVAITPNLATGRKLSAVWGVHCVVAEDAKDLDDMVSRAGSIAFRDGFAKAGQRVIIVAGVPLGTPGTTNMLRIASVGPACGGDMEARRRSAPHTRVQRNGGVKKFGDRTAGLCLRRQLLELGLVRTWDFRGQREVHGGDGKPLTLFLERDIGLGLHLLGGELGLAENQ